MRNNTAYPRINAHIRILQYDLLLQKRSFLGRRIAPINGDVNVARADVLGANVVLEILAPSIKILAANANVSRNMGERILKGQMVGPNPYAAAHINPNAIGWIRIRPPERHGTMTQCKDERFF
jgi:hypothetical protein